MPGTSFQQKQKKDLIKLRNNRVLSLAKVSPKDEFYTTLPAIEKEMQTYLDVNPLLFKDKIIFCPCDDPDRSKFVKYFRDHFTEFGIKQLIASCYAYKQDDIQGRVSITTRQEDGEPVTNTKLLNGNGDFLSDEVTTYRDLADFIITNPPFSQFRTFFPWVLQSKAKFSLIGTIAAAVYFACFPSFTAGDAWIGSSKVSGDMEFQVPETYPLKARGMREDEEGNRFVRVTGIRWFTNIPRENKHKLNLMTMEDNIKNSKYKTVKGHKYQEYVNYDALEVPYVDAIPSDYYGIMGVPITFLDKFDTTQFKIIGFSRFSYDVPEKKVNLVGYKEYKPDGTPTGKRLTKTRGPLLVGGLEGRNVYRDDLGNELRLPYERIFIQRIVQ